MGSKYQLSVSEPCHENWDNMTPDDKGRFCGACQKQVVDFSVMSDRELIQFFKKPSDGSVCGRFMSNQLERDLQIPARRLPWIKFFFQILIPAFFVTKLSAQRTIGKPAVVNTGDTAKIRREPRNLILGMVLPTRILPAAKDTISKTVAMINEGIIKGKVTDTNGLPVPYATIDPGNGLAKAADVNGEFNMDAAFIKNNQRILVSSAGFESNSISIDKQESLLNGLQIQLLSKASLPEVVITGYGYTKGKVIMGAASMVRKETLQVQKLAVQETTGRMTIFPNPVRSGSALHISLDKQIEGYYKLTIFSYSGQLIHQKEVWIDSGARVLSFETPAAEAGNYLLSLINKETGEKIGERFVVAD